MAIEDSYRYFKIEAREIVDRLSGEILKLEKGEPSAESVRGLIRQASTLRGAARIVKMTTIVDLANKIDLLMVPYRETSRAIASEDVEQLRSALDAIKRHLAALSAAHAAVSRTALSTTISQRGTDFSSFEQVRLISA